MSLLPKAFATSFVYKKKQYVTIGGGTILSTATSNDIARASMRSPTNRKMHSNPLFKELNIFPVFPKLVRGATVLTALDLMIVWADNCWVIVHFCDLVRGGELCSKFVISTGRHILHARADEGNVVWIVFTNRTVDEVHFEKADLPRPTAKFSLIRRHRFECEGTPSIAHDRLPPHLGVSITTTAGQTFTISSHVIPDITTSSKTRDVQMFQGRWAYAVLRRNNIVFCCFSPSANDTPVKICFSGRFSTMLVLPKKNANSDESFAMAGSRGGCVSLFDVLFDFGTAQIDCRWYGGTSAVQFISTIKDCPGRSVIGFLSGEVRIIERFPPGPPPIMLTLNLPAVRTFVVYSAAWGMKGMLVITGKQLMEIPSTDKFAMAFESEFKQMYIGEFRQLKTAVCSTGDYQCVATVACTRTNILVYVNWLFKSRDNPVVLESILEVAHPAELRSKTKTTVKSLLFKVYKIFAGTTKGNPEGRAVYHHCFMRLSDQTAEEIGNSEYLTAAAILALPTTHPLYQVQSATNKCRIVIGTKSGNLYWGLMPVTTTKESVNEVVDMILMEASQATAKSPVVGMIGFEGSHLRLITRHGSMIHLVAKPNFANTTIDGGLAVSNIVEYRSKLGLILDLVLMNGEILIVSYKRRILNVYSWSRSCDVITRVPVSSAKSYCHLACDMKDGHRGVVVLYYLEGGKVKFARWTVPNQSLLMVGYGCSRVTAARVLIPWNNSKDDDTLIVTGHQDGQINLFVVRKDSGNVEFLAPVARFKGPVTCITSETSPPENGTHAVVVGGAFNQLMLITIKNNVSVIRFFGPAFPNAAGVRSLELITLHSPSEPRIVALTSDNYLEVYRIKSMVQDLYYHDHPSSYDMYVEAMVSRSLNEDPDGGKNMHMCCLLPNYYLVNERIAVPCEDCDMEVNEADRERHPMCVDMVVVDDDGGVCCMTVNDSQPEKESFELTVIEMNSRCFTCLYVPSPISQELFVAVSGCRDGSLWIYAFCDLRSHCLFGHWDRCHETEIISLSIAPLRIDKFFYIFVSSLDSNGVVIIRRLLVTAGKIHFDPHPLCYYSVVRKPCQIIVVPQRGHAIVTGEGIQIIEGISI